MTPAQSQLVETVQQRFGPKVATTEAEAIAPWLTDWRGRYHGEAPALLSPGSTNEVAAIVALAAAAGVPLVPQGGNTGMVGGATPPTDGSALLLSLRRMNRIRALSPVSNLAVAEAGVILADLRTAAEVAGRRFPLDLGARGSATIGGLVSTNAGGTQVLRFGTMRSLVAGVEAVLPDGSIHNGVAALKKDNRGYDLNQLLIGAEGTLGIVTAATLRLVPGAAARAVGWVGLESPAAALQLLRMLEAGTSAVESFEILPEKTLALVLRHVPGTRRPLATAHPWHVLIEAVATDPTAEAPAALLERLLGPALERELAGDAVIAASEAQAEDFWRIRHSISEAERAGGPALQHDISVPVDDMPRFMIEGGAEAEARFPGTEAVAYGHLGDGNVHFHVRAPAGVDPQVWYAEDGPGISRHVHDMVVAAGGSISAEHGIGQMKRAELERLSAPSRMTVLRAIKTALDPHNILNPGKLVALAPDAARP
ncbi:FAD-binding oxidoreductase [Sphingomonas psychrotolerans]|uniref:Hydroxyacid dehydrogenase n=1 Tax=Sphingomonas psychrotolerans TaxID=1327635 RepID=A0A2K8MMV7_9SPHN|nr:FAD-binding oxidoreductase [Sphingomonas psychrotolerans]ATY32651.1 hydroxyacid dehydrogenase [Sphingomonas psychrotolerans]